MSDTDRQIKSTAFNRTQEKKKISKRFVNPIDKWDDHECLVLGAMGYHSHFISKKTKLSEGQVGYRLRLFGIVRYDIRNGDSQFSRLMLTTAHDTISQKVNQFIRNGLKKD